MIKRGPDRGYLLDPDKSLFISDTPEKEEAAKSEFAVEGLTLNFVCGSRYLGACLGPQKALEAWVKPQVEAWSHGVRVHTHTHTPVSPVTHVEVYHIIHNFFVHTIYTPFGGAE